LERIIWLENGDQNEVIELAISLEGHPDNVVPAMLGMPSRCYNKRSAEAQRTQKGKEDFGGWEICEVPWHGSVVPVVAIPDFELSTQEARRVLAR